MEGQQMNLEGLWVGGGAFLLIGLFHPLVIKGEYYFGRKICWVFFLGGLVSIGCSVRVEAVSLSALVAVLGFTCFWSIKEVFEQEQRVKKGWFPANPNRT